MSRSFLRVPHIFRRAAIIFGVGGLTLVSHSVQSLGAQSPPGAQTIVVIDTQGNATIVGDGPTSTFHPLRVLVHFRPGMAANFLPGSGQPRTFPGNRNLYLVTNPPGLSVAEVLERVLEQPCRLEPLAICGNSLLDHLSLVRLEKRSERDR
jgi:hypothetical protein